MPAFANSRGIAHAGSGGMSIVLPDVCQVSTPVGPIPIPFPNIGMASDTSGGPSTVTIEGNMPMAKGATYSQSTGDQAGSVGGLMCGLTAGACEFMLYSFDVKLEGNNV